jgi:adenine phosphoribosyltransferase
MKLDLLKHSLEAAPIVRLGSYDYFVHPITDGIPSMPPELLKEVLDAMVEVGDFSCDIITAPEAMGIPLAVPLSLRLGIPYNIIRKRRYSLPGEVQVHQITGYSEKELFINGIKAGDRVVLVDDVLSTGGTLRAVVQALQKMGVELVDVIVVVEKGRNKSKLENELGLRIKTLVKVEVREGRLVVLS